MTDRELLEMAAKAAGIEGEWWETGCGYTAGLYKAGRAGNEKAFWNPLSDDGDALRLAVKLDMNVFQAAKSAYALPSDDDGTHEQQVRYCDVDGDPYAATRRAIVRAAAEIGRQMP